MQENSGSNWDEAFSSKNDLNLYGINSQVYNKAQLVLLPPPAQSIAGPVVVYAKGLTSPNKQKRPDAKNIKNTVDNRKRNNVKYKDANSQKWKPLSLAPANIQKGAAESTLNVVYVSHAEAIEASLFDPNNDSRFEVRVII